MDTVSSLEHQSKLIRKLQSERRKLSEAELNSIRERLNTIDERENRSQDCKNVEQSDEVDVKIVNQLKTRIAELETQNQKLMTIIKEILIG